MAGTSLAVGMVAVVATLSLGLVVAGGAAVATQRVAAAADAAALAASDVATGAVVSADSACTVAARVAEANGAHLVRCALRGLVATVEVAASYVGFGTSARARAGPPGHR